MNIFLIDEVLIGCVFSVFLSIEHLFNLASNLKVEAHFLSDFLMKVFKLIFRRNFIGNEFVSNLIKAGGFFFESNSNFPQKLFDFLRRLNMLNCLSADVLNVGDNSSWANASGS